MQNGSIGSAAMAKRRFLDKQPLTQAEGLTALIMMGVGLTLGGISVTICMALSAAAQGSWQELWLSGRASVGARALAEPGAPRHALDVDRALARDAVVGAFAQHAVDAGRRPRALPGGALRLRAL